MPLNIYRKTDVTRTIRFERRQDFGLELLARLQRRSVNSLVQLAVDRLLNDPNHGLFTPNTEDAGAPRNILDDVWDLDEADRIINVAIRFPSLLDERWSPIWKAIQDDRSLWTKTGAPNRREIRRKWEALKSNHAGRTVGRPRTKR